EQGTEAAADRPQQEENASRRLPIVAVDDDGLVLMNTTLMLEYLGHTVFEAMAGPEALDILRKQQVDLAIRCGSPRQAASPSCAAWHGRKSPG
ncbi:hypothetical protein ACC685_36535, partial [Rhizobium ruizarguesonis]